MLINLKLDENNVIVSWTSYPLNEEGIVFEIEDPYTIHIGLDKFINDEIVKDEVGYQHVLEKQAKYDRIQVLKNNLKESDYKLFKYLDGELTEEEYQDIKLQRHQWRVEINQLEAELL